MSAYDDYLKDEGRYYEDQEARKRELQESRIDKVIKALKGPVRRAFELKTEKDKREWAIDYLKHKGELPADYTHRR